MEDNGKKTQEPLVTNWEEHKAKVMGIKDDHKADQNYKAQVYQIAKEIAADPEFNKTYSEFLKSGSDMAADRSDKRAFQELVPSKDPMNAIRNDAVITARHIVEKEVQEKTGHRQLSKSAEWDLGRKEAAWKQEVKDSAKEAVKAMADVKAAGDSKSAQPHQVPLKSSGNMSR